jgi:Planctomycete cytochrome C
VLRDANRSCNLALSTAMAIARADQREFFETGIRPLLGDKYFACHTATHMGGLEMKSREALLQGGRDGPPLVPGKPEESLPFKAVSYTDECSTAAGVFV